MKRKIMAFGTALAMASVFGVQAAFGAVNIKVDKLLQPKSSELVNIEGYNFAEMRTLFEMFGIDVDWNSAKKTASAKVGDKEIVIYTADNKAVVDGKEQDIVPKAEIINGKTMLPVRYIGELLGAKVEWDKEAQTILITTEQETKLDDDITYLTYEEALELAKKNDSSLKNLDDSIDYLDELRDDLSISYKTLDNYSAYFNTLEKQQTSASDELSMGMQENASSIINVCRNIKSTDMKKSEKSINEQMINDTIEFKLLSYLVAIDNYEMNIKLAEENIALLEQNVSNLKLKYELGMESQYNLLTAENNLKSSKSDLENLKYTLANQKTTLNNLLGIKDDKEVKIELNTDFKQHDDVKLDSYITVKTQSDPSILLLKDALELAQYTNRTTGIYTGDSKIQAANNVKSAERSLSDAQDNMAKNIKNAYNGLEQLKEKDKALKVKVDQAIADYNAVAAGYMAGSSTIYQVNQAKLGILSAENNVESNKLSYITSYFTFERPYLLSSNN